MLLAGCFDCWCCYCIAKKIPQSPLETYTISRTPPSTSRNRWALPPACSVPPRSRRCLCSQPGAHTYLRSPPRPAAAPTRLLVRPTADPRLPARSITRRAAPAPTVARPPQAGGPRQAALTRTRKNFAISSKKRGLTSQAQPLSSSSSFLHACASRFASSGLPW